VKFLKIVVASWVLFIVVVVTVAAVSGNLLPRPGAVVLSDRRDHRLRRGTDARGRNSDAGKDADLGVLPDEHDDWV
jgi:hypothetical protein